MATYREMIIAASEVIAKARARHLPSSEERATDSSDKSTKTYREELSDDALHKPDSYLENALRPKSKKPLTSSEVASVLFTLESHRNAYPEIRWQAPDMFTADWYRTVIESSNHPEPNAVLNELAWRSRQWQSEHAWPQLSPGYHERTDLLQQAAERLVTRNGVRVILEAPSGFGKTLLASAICQYVPLWETFYDPPIWIKFQPGDSSQTVDRTLKLLVEALGGPIVGRTGATIASLHSLLVARLSTRSALIVLDDVPNSGTIQQLLVNVPNVAYLITTQNRQVDIAIGGDCISVPPLTLFETKRWLTARIANHLTTIDLPLIDTLAAQTQGTPATVYQYAVTLYRLLGKEGYSLADAINRLYGSDRSAGNAAQQGFTNNLNALTPDLRKRFVELAVFHKAVAIPIHLIGYLWRATGKITGQAAVLKALDEMVDAGLIAHLDRNHQDVILHDLVWEYLQECLPEMNLRGLQQIFIRECKAVFQTWDQVPQEETYLWDHLVYHLIGAGSGTDVYGAIGNMRFLVSKIEYCGAWRALQDISAAAHMSGNKVLAERLKRALTALMPLLRRLETRDAIIQALYGYFNLQADLQAFAGKLLPDLPSTRFTMLAHPDELSHPALVQRFDEYGARMSGVAFSPDGQRLYAVSDGEQILRWAVHDGEVLFPFGGHQAAVRGVAASPNGVWLVSGGDDSQIILWEAETGRSAYIWWQDGERIMSVAFSPNSRLIASGSADGTIHVRDVYRDVDTDSVPWRQSIPRAPVLSVAFSPDNRYLACGSADHTVYLYDLQTGTVHQRLDGHSDAVHGIAFAPSGRWLVSASADCSIIVWNLATGQPQHRLTDSLKALYCVAINTAGTLIASAGDDKNVYLWTVQNPANADQIAPARIIGRHTNDVRGAAFDQGDYLATACSANAVNIWNTRMNTSWRYRNRRAAFWYKRLAMSDDGQSVLSGNSAGVVECYDTATQRLSATYTDHDQTVVGLIDTSSHLLTAYEDGTLTMRDSASGVVKHIKMAGEFRHIVLSNDHQWVFSVGHDAVLRGLHLATGDQFSRQHPDMGKVNRITLDSTGRWAFIVDESGHLGVWDVRSWTYMACQAHADPVWSVAVHPSRLIIATGCYDGMIGLWEYQPEDGVFECCQMITHSRETTAAVTWLTFSPDGKTLLASATEGTLKLWDWQTGKCIAASYMNSMVLACQFNPVDPTQVIAAGETGLYWLRLTSQ